jgi:hypothetical protein
MPNEPVVEEVRKTLGTIVKLLAAQIGPDLKVAERAPLLDRLGVDRHAIAAVCGTTPEVVSVRLAESRRGKGGARRATGSAKQAPGTKAPPAEPKAAVGADV